MKIRLITTLLLLVIFGTANIFAQDIFVRKNQIPVPANEPGGWGNVVSGVDLDGDGKMEIYAVNDNWGDAADELIPRIYKFEEGESGWDTVWYSVLTSVEKQNTWPALAVADLDKDGKHEIVWGPVNNLSTVTDLNPDRIVVYEVKGDGSDILGIDDGNGNYLPNASYELTELESQNIRPFIFQIVDIDGDGVDEILFPDRQATGTTHLHIGVVSVDNIPDNGDGSETWTMEFSNLLSSPHFARIGTVNSSINEPGGFGNVVTGEDIDGDGRMDMYVVNDNWGDTADELIPRLYKFEWTGSYWEEIWVTTLDSLSQNTWPPLNITDLDGDGKKEVTWGPVNNFGNGNTTPARIVVFETKGDGSDVMGVEQGTNYLPNAEWNLDLAPSTNVRPFDVEVVDIDSDGKQEIIFADRVGTMHFGVISVDKIPDQGDMTDETWTLETSGTALGMAGGSKWDVAVINSIIYVFNASGSIFPVNYNNGSYSLGTSFKSPVVYPFKSAIAVDIDTNGTKEILVSEYNTTGSGKVYVLVPDADTLKGFEVGDVTGLGYGTKLTGAGVGDIDNDGLLDYVFGARGFDGVYRLKYLGGDITSSASYEVSILDKGVTGNPAVGQMDVIVVANIDSDPEAEILYTGIPRDLPVAAPVTILNYSNGNIAGNQKWDLAVIENRVYLTAQSGTVYPLQYLDGQWQILQPLTNVGGGYGSFKGSVVADVDGDGSEEIIVGSWLTAGAGKVYLLKEFNGGLKSHLIADLGTDFNDADLRLNGAAAGDIDNDGFMDFVFGSRDGNGAIFRVEHRGGDITDINNYSTQKLDEAVVANANQLDIVNLANVDSDPELEIVYSGIPRDGGLFPIVILDLLVIETTPIADVRVDNNGDLIPDNLGQEFTVLGVVTSVNPTASANRFAYYIQDETGGIYITKGGETGGGTVYNIGDKVRATGTVAHFRGLTQLDIANVDSNVVFLGAATPVEPVTIELGEYLAAPEKYEGTLIKIPAVKKADNSPNWPAENSDANFLITDGTFSTILRIDRDTDIDGQTEPTYPMSVVGVGSQYTSGSSVLNDGYQIFTSRYSDITGNVASPPSKYFYFTEETRTNFDSTEFSITSSDQDVQFVWNKTIDLNNDNLIYQFQIIAGSKVTSLNPTPNSDTTITVKGLDLLKAIGVNFENVKLTIRAKGKEASIIPSVDTLTTTFVNNITSLVHTASDLSVTIFNEGTFGADRNFAGPGVVYKGQNGLFSSGMVFGTKARGSVNGLIPSWESAFESAITDINVESSALNITSNSNFDLITEAVLNDSGATIPYNVKIIQKSYSKSTDKFIFLRYGYVNMGTSTLEDFYAGVFVDWDIDANTYATNSGGYVDGDYLVYQYDATSPYYYGTSAVNGLDGMIVTDLFPSNNETLGRTSAFTFISTFNNTPIAGNNDFRAFTGTALGNIAVGDTAWVTFAVVAGDDLAGIKVNNQAAVAKAKLVGFTSLTTDIEEIAAVPETFSLEQNYPNPFNPSTTIRFGLPSESVVDLRIYDILGQEVAALITNQNLKAGTHEVRFDASKLASGTYIYRIAAGNNVVSKKMLLIK